MNIDILTSNGNIVNINELDFELNNLNNLKIKLIQYHFKIFLYIYIVIHFNL